MGLGLVCGQGDNVIYDFGVEIRGDYPLGTQLSPLFFKWGFTVNFI